MSGLAPTQGSPDRRAGELLQQATTLTTRETGIAAMLGLNGEALSTIAPLLASILSGALGDDAAREAVRSEALAVFSQDAEALNAALTDIFATAAKDYAPGREITALLFARGIHALMAHRVSHALWRSGREDMAMATKTVLGRAFATDIHPAARFGRGIWLDHGLGFVVGETAVVNSVAGHPNCRSNMAKSWRAPRSLRTNRM